MGSDAHGWLEWDGSGMEGLLLLPCLPRFLLLVSVFVFVFVFVSVSVFVYVIDTNGTDRLWRASGTLLASCHISCSWSSWSSPNAEYKIIPEPKGSRMEDFCFVHLIIFLVAFCNAWKHVKVCDTVSDQSSYICPKASSNYIKSQQWPMWKVFF